MPPWLPPVASFWGSLHPAGVLPEPLAPGLGPCVCRIWPCPLAPSSQAPRWLTAVALCQEEYRRRGFQEVATPNIYNCKLWETSGHWQHYSENIFSFPVEEGVFALKPMNCPGHW